MDEAEIEALLAKASNALEPSEAEKLHHLIETLKYITRELDKKRVSVKRLQQMLFGSSSERSVSPRLKELLKAIETDQADSSDEQSEALDTSRSAEAERNGRGSDDAQQSSPEPKRKGHGRRGADAYSGGQHTHLSHPEIKPKDPCPKCDKGKLYLQKRPKVLVRLTGSAPIQAATYSYDWFRCNLCGFIVNTPLPAEVGSAETYDESVTSAVALMRYGFGMPFNRLANLQEQVNVPLPSSTQWDLVNRAAEHLAPVFTELIRAATRGEVVYNDDTTSRVLELMGMRKARPPDSKDKRTGCFTTGVVSTGEHQVVLYFTGQNHAGENIADVLANCDDAERTIVQMGDGLSRNEPKILPDNLVVIQANCMTHARRKYVEVADHFPEQCLHVIGEIAKVYKADAEARRARMSGTERLRHHQEHSKPVMDQLRVWLNQQLDDKLVEPNSGFGEAARYMLKRWERLTRFLTVANAPLDTNICERALKRAIRHRKNSMFYKTLHGAWVGDIYMSFIHTCELNGINTFEYLTALIRQGERLAEDPNSWLPWNYAARLPNANTSAA